MASSCVRDVTTTIEKCGLEDGQQLQWQIRNFDVIQASSVNLIRQNFGPLNGGKVLIKLDLTRMDGDSYQLGVQAHPTKDVMWMSIEFKIDNYSVESFCIHGDPRSVPGNRLSCALTIPNNTETLKITFVPEILLSVSNIVEDPGVNGVTQEQGSFPDPRQPSDNQPSSDNQRPLNDWVNKLSVLLQQVFNQCLSECQHWAEFFRNYPTEFTRMQQNFISTVFDSELVRESPRMIQDLLTELHNNPDYATINQRIRDLMIGVHQHCETLRAQAPNNHQEPRQNTSSASQPQSHPQAFAGFAPLLQGLQNLFNPAQESGQNNISQSQESLEQVIRHFQQIYQSQIQTILTSMNDFNAAMRQTTNTEQPEATSQAGNQEQVVEEAHQTAPEQTMEEIQQPLIDLTDEDDRYSSVQTEETPVLDASAPSDADWTFNFTAKGISGYVRHVKGLGSRVPYRGNFCPSYTWALPDGTSAIVELAYALHPDAPFICLVDRNDSTDIAFIQTLLDGHGREIHKIDSFSDSYHGFTPDMLLQSAELDDIVRIKIESIPNMD